MMKSFVFALGALLLSPAPGAAQVPPAGASSAASSFEEGPCPFEAKPEILKQVRCGYVTVPENRNARDGRQLRLAVAVLRSLNPTPEPDPIVMIHGGPGGRLVEYAPGMIQRKAMDRFRADREVVLYDQRGTGYSDPRFCPALNTEWRRIPRMGLPAAERHARFREALARCREAMLRQGVDLAQYNSRVNAADLADIRRALGYSEWNLLAASYGTRVALAAVRWQPKGIRSVFMDGPIPPDQPTWAYRAFAIADVVKRLSEKCAADPDCNSAYPNVEQNFWKGVEEFEREPVVVGRTGESSDKLVFNGDQFVLTVFQALYSGRSLATVPLLVQQLRARDDKVLNDIALRLIREPEGQESMGLKFTVACYDEAPLNTPEARERLRASAVLIDLTDAQTNPSLCDALHQFRASGDELIPVTSDIPTLIFTGEFDTATHRSFGPMVARTLSRVTVAEIPGAGHMETGRFDCTKSIVQDFFDEPRDSIDTACVAKLPPLSFNTESKEPDGER